MDGGEIDPEQVGGLGERKTLLEAVLSYVLSEGLGCLRERLGFQGLKGDGDKWQKGSESLSVRFRPSVPLFQFSLNHTLATLQYFQHKEVMR
jgi:hypothetical protein